MKFSEHDKMILSGKVAKPTFRGNITPMRGGSRKSHRKNIKPGVLTHYILDFRVPLTVL